MTPPSIALEAVEGRKTTDRKDRTEMTGPPPYHPSEEQALTIFNNAAEQVRLLTSQRWHIANYALLAFAALAAAPDWMEKGSWLDTRWVSLGAIVLVGLVLVATWLHLSRMRIQLGN